LHLIADNQSFPIPKTNNILVKKFLVIQTAFLGDVILATPVVSELARLFPDSRIDILVRKGNETLLSNNQKINEVLILDKKAPKFQTLKILLKKIRANKYDEVINLHRFASTGILTAFSGAKHKVGFDKNPFSFAYSIKIQHKLTGEHEVQRNLACIAHLGAASMVKPELFPSEIDFQKVKPFMEQKYYCLAPASVWFTKQLPISKWIELARILSKLGKVYFIGGPGDKDLCDSIIEKVEGDSCENVAGNFSFLESAVLMKNAKRNYVNDSGPMLICSAMNAATTAFYCSTIPSFGFGPLADDSEIIETELELTCRPCGLHGFKACPKSHFNCGNSVNLNVKF
jgi:ADP-heptose:LPS heptosyltransferase